MTSAPRARPIAAFLGLAAALLLLESLLLVARRADPGIEVLAAAATIDLVVLVPLAWWLVVVRGGAAAPITLVPVFFASLGAASAIVPAGHHAALRWFELLAIPIELGVLAFVVRSVRRTLQRVGASADAFEALQDAIRGAFGHGRVAALAGTEITTLWFAFASWGRSAPSGPGVFTIHRKSGAIALIWAFAGLVVVESAAVHLLVARWSSGWALVLTIASLLSLVYVVAFAQSVRHMPCVAREDGLVLRQGFLRRAFVPWRLVDRVSDVQAAKDPDAIDLSLFATPRMVVETAAPIRVEGLWGTGRSATRLLLAPDDETGLRQAIADRLAAR